MNRFFRVLLVSAILCILFCYCVSAAEVQTAPVLINVTDAVKPGDVFQVFGDGIYKDGFIAAVTDDTESLFPDESCVYIDNAEFDENGQYITMYMPESLSCGAYKLWIKNNTGWSDPIYINAARTQWISENIIYSGIEILVNGRNFDGREFGAHLNSFVRLNDGHNTYNAILNEVNPFAIKFTVDDTVPCGEYIVEVSNDGVVWDSVDDGQKLTVIDTAADPLDLKVGWSGVFNYDNSFNISRFGAVSDGKTDNSFAIQTACRFAADTGGGVVYIPEGNYLFRDTINLPGNVIIRGEGKDKSILTFSPDGQKYAILSDRDGSGADGKQGLVDFTIAFDSNVCNNLMGTIFIWLGENYEFSRENDNLDSRTADYIVMKNFKVVSSKELPSYDEVSQRYPQKGLIVIQARDHVLVDNCTFIGYDHSMSSSMMRYYFKGVNNKIDNILGGFYNVSTYSIIENNTITKSDDKSTVLGNNVQGIYTRDHSYVAGNTVKNTGDPAADGEIIAAESYLGGTKMLGNITSAGEKYIVVEPEIFYPESGLVSGGNYGGEYAWDITRKGSGFWSVVITKGKGLGQIRKILSMNESTKTIEIENNWDIIPDKTSEFAVVIPLESISIYNNTAYNCAWSYLLWGPVYDLVICDNKGTDTEGIQIHSVHTAKELQTEEWPVYFTRCERNSFSGTSWLTSSLGINYIASFERPLIDTVSFLGAVIRDNELIGDGKECEQILRHRKSFTVRYPIYSYYNGITVSNGNRPVPAEENTSKGFIIARNRIQNSDYGIMVGGYDYKYPFDMTSSAEGIIITDNSFDNVKNSIADYSEPFKMRLEGLYKSGIKTLEMAVLGNYAYIGSEEDGLRIIDMTDDVFNDITPDSDEYKGVFIDGYSNIEIYNGYLYAAYKTEIRKFSLDTPAAPKLVAQVSFGYVISMDFKDDYMAVLLRNNTNNRLYIYDISGKGINYAGIINDNTKAQRELCFYGQYLFVTYEDELKIFDTDMLPYLRLIKTITFNENSLLTGVHCDDNGIYIVDMNGPIYIADLKNCDIKNLSFDSFSAYLPENDGNGDYLFFMASRLDNGVLYASSLRDGNGKKATMFMIDVTNPQAPVLKSKLRTSNQIYSIEVDGDVIYALSLDGTLYKRRVTACDVLIKEAERFLITDIAKNETSVICNIKNTDFNIESGVTIAALYSDSGEKLEKLVIKPLCIQALSNIDVEFDFGMDIGSYTAQVFVFSSIQSLKPAAYNRSL